MATNIYPRGTTQWWRRSVNFVAVVSDPITIRMSLKTRCPREARARAGYLEMEMTVVETTVAEELRTRIAPDDMRAVYRSAFEATLDRYIVQQAATPFRAEAHAVANLAYARYFTLIASTPELPEADQALRERLTASGLTQKDADALFVTVGRHRSTPPIGHAHLAGYLRSAGVKPTEDNLRSMSRVAAAAYRNACLAATEGLDLPNFGATKVFLDSPDQIIRSIDDNEDLLLLKHTKELMIAALPDSLKLAVRTFLVARAIRLARGQIGKHSSMLINASRFTDVQRQLRNEVHALVDQVRSSVRVNGALDPETALDDPEIMALHSAWRQEYESGVDLTWSAVQPFLLDAVAPVSVVEVNSRSSGNLDYADNEKHGLNVIAVGGFSLSRGLTLEGLMVSYFLRNSMMYDTLMQMGRWFGYRPGYEDLCRVWMPEEAEGWYAHVADSTEELRDELRKMEAAKATPEQFGLKVRSHPDTLIVTARNKMGSGERLVVSIGLANKFAETSILRRDASALETNRKLVRNLVADLRYAGHDVSNENKAAGGYLISGAPVGPVRQFISAFQNHPGSLLTNPQPVARYIDARAEGELSRWDVLFTSIDRRDARSLVDGSLGFEIVCQRRAAGKASDSSNLRVTNKQRVASRGVEKAGLTAVQIEDVQQRYRAAHPERGDSRWNYPDRIYREARARPLLIVHLLAIGEENDDLSGQQPVAAWSISFPQSETEEEKVEYVVNTTWMRENFRDDLDEDEMDGDDDR